MSTDFIPIWSYTPIYYHIVLLVTIFTFFHTQVFRLQDHQNLDYIRFAGPVFLAFVLLYMGLRPIHGAFTDMMTYAKRFYRYQYGNTIITTNDIFFQYFMFFSSKVVSAQTFFFICSALYVIPCYVVSKKWFKQYWFYAFLMLAGSFTFWAYGTNGIRNGIATSFFLMALSQEKRLWQIVWMVLAANIHATMTLPSLAFVITWFYNKPNSFFYFWLACIPLSLALPGFWENLFATMVEDDRASYLTDEVDQSRFASTGFRWDFLIYGAIGVFAGWYYIFKKNLQDKLYIQLFNVFLFANAFWILVIRANFSNRFAYLSWFMLALVIIYPWLKYKLEKNQHQKIGYIVLAYFMFTYIMNVIL